LEEGRPYSVAFVDIRMPPGLDGIRTVRSMWAIDPDVLVVLCSAYCDYSWEEIVDELGRTDRFLILKKPFDRVEVQQFAAALTERWVLARTDAATGLLNRRAFHEHLHREWVRSIQQRTPLACVMLDVDYFKRINDTLGHQAGDRAIASVADGVARLCRPQDFVCRYGGEEICILLTNTTESEAHAWADRTRLALSQSGFEWKGKNYRLTASFGVAERLEDVCSHEELIDRADQSLRMAKQTGRNRAMRWSHVNGAEAPQLLALGWLFEDVKARDVMTSPITTLDAHMTAGDAVDFFLKSRIGSASVVDGDGKLAGVVSEKDLLELLITADAWSTPLCDIMNTNVVCYEEDCPAQAIFEFLCRVAIRRVIIVENERPIGIISRGSYLRWGRNLARLGLQHSSTNARFQVDRAASALMDRATHLVHQLSEKANDEQIVAPIVAEASKMQELLEDLLAWTRYVPPHNQGECALACADRS
jgi:diguanylate cyclase (GGDEF)-like protein